MPVSFHRIVPALLVAAISGMFSSCVSLSEPAKTMTVHTTRPATIIVEGAAKATVNNKAKFTLKKGKKVIPVKLVADSAEQSIVIKTQSTELYYLSVAYLGVGLLERNNPKRYSFPSDIYLIPGDTLGVKTIRPTLKGDVMLHFSVPYVNAFYFQPKGEYAKTNSGFLGMSVGLDYYYHDKQFLNLTAGAGIDFPVLAPAPVKYEGINKRMETMWLALTNNYKIGHLSLGCGLSFGQNNWTGPSASDTTQRAYITNYSGGLMLNSYWQVSKTLNIGLLYRPSFVGFGINTSRYEHMISLDLAWKIPLNPYASAKK